MVELLLHYKYIAFFIGMIIGGDIVLITGVYLAVQRQMNIWYLIFLATTATLISDLIWYYLGKFLPNNKFISRIFKNHNPLTGKISEFFKRHSFKTVFYSKFIYGTRTIVQLLGGAHRINFKKFMLVDTLGTIGYIFLIVLLGYTLHVGITGIEGIVHSAQITFAIFFVLLFTINMLIQRNIKKRILD